MKLKNEEASCKMGTQIAITPVVKGSEAICILNEMNRCSSEKSKSGEKKLKDYFNRFIKSI